MRRTTQSGGRGRGGGRGTNGGRGTAAAKRSRSVSKRIAHDASTAKASKRLEGDQASDNLVSASSQHGDKGRTNSEPIDDNDDEVMSSSEESDSTVKRSTQYQTRLNVNFFVPPSQDEAHVKLFSIAKKWMAKMSECDLKLELLP